MHEPTKREQLEQEKIRIDEEYAKHYEETGQLADHWRNAAHDEIDWELNNLKED